MLTNQQEDLLAEVQDMEPLLDSLINDVDRIDDKLETVTNTATQIYDIFTSASNNQHYLFDKKEDVELGDRLGCAVEQLKEARRIAYDACALLCQAAYKVRPKVEDALKAKQLTPE